MIDKGIIWAALAAAIVVLGASVFAGFLAGDPVTVCPVPPHTATVSTGGDGVSFAP